PERVDPGNKMYQIHNTPKVVGGVSAACLELAQLLYGKIVQTIFPVSSVEVAEMTKLLENTYRAVNIGLVNEMALMCDRLGINIWEVIEAAKTKPFGFMPFYPGPGIGGHCIPLDPHYLAWKVRSFNLEPRFIELADAINSRMPEFVISKVAHLLNVNLSKALSASRVFVMGIAYKRDTNDCRESPATYIIEKLVCENKATVFYHDPYCPRANFSFGELESVALESLPKADICLILTDHSTVDYKTIAKNYKLILDTRNVFRGLKQPQLFYL
ncbi:MAG: nucleotide sugar dehydrogenase, partial [Elusimicrobia bacterium]|nr:nucleotide sugar dehydrogenase [Elusimicrobiota bacterium]